MRVLHILHHSLPHLTGYGMRSSHIMRHQRQMGLEPAAVTSLRHGDTGTTQEEIGGTTYFRTARRDGPWRRLRERLPLGREAAVITSLVERIEDLARRIAPEILHAHSPATCGVAGLRAGRRLGLPVVYEVRDFWENASVDLGKWRAGSARYRLARAAENYVLRRAHAVVAICEAQRQEIMDRGVPATGVTVVPNGVDADYFAPREPSQSLAKELGLEGRFVLAYIGAMLPYEGLPVLLEAVARAQRERRDVALLLVGAGEGAESVRETARSQGVEGLLRWAGAVPQERVRDYYALADVLVYPRLPTATGRLTTPLKPLEAMAMGKPVVASDLPAMREIITHEETGLLVSPADPGPLAAACLRLAGEPGTRTRLGEAGREWVRRTRRWQDQVARYTPVYERIRARRSR